MSRKRLLLFGDSLIDYGNWSGRLSEYQVISSGMPGERTSELLWRIPRALPEVPPDLIVLMTGTNDLLFGDCDFPRILKQIIGGLQQSYPAALIIPTSLLPYRLSGIADMIVLVNEQIKNISLESGCHYLDLYTLFTASEEPALFEMDGVHLSEAGYLLWETNLKRFLAALLAKRPD